MNPPATAAAALTGHKAHVKERTLLRMPLSSSWTFALEIYCTKYILPPRRDSVNRILVDYSVKERSRDWDKAKV